MTHPDDAPDTAGRPSGRQRVVRDARRLVSWAVAHWLPLSVGACAALACAVLARRGPGPYFDAASYVAVSDSFANGHGFTTTLVPSFSEYSAIDFLQRGGRIPFTDFPAGFAAVCGVVAWFLGARHAVIAVAVAGAAVLAALLLLPAWKRRDRDGSHWHLMAAVLVAVGVLCMPAFQIVLRGGLAEPLFIAMTVGVALLLIREQPQRLEWAVVLAGLAGNIRFVGLPCVLVPAVLLWRRDGWRKSAAWTALAVVPAALNTVLGAAAGGGHRIALREWTGTDLRIGLHSIAGWVSYSEGKVVSLYRGHLWPSWWVFVLALAWVGAVLVALFALVTGRSIMPRPITITLSLAGVHSLSLVGGMLLFDSLVAPDSRLMLPAAVLTVAGVLWWALERIDGRVVVGVAAAWLVVAVQPWNLRPEPEPRAYPDMVAAVGDAEVVLSDEADIVYWVTGTPVAYLPGRTRLLTGDAVDRRAELEQLPCLLLDADGVITIAPRRVLVDESLVADLDALVDGGALVVEQFGAVARYTPTGQGC